MSWILFIAVVVVAIIALKNLQKLIAIKSLRNEMYARKKSEKNDQEY